MDQYEPLEQIGSGSFGIIRRVKRITDGKIFARKEINYTKMSEKEKMQLVSEVNILRELRHTHIVRYFERHVDKERCKIYIIMEYCDNGDLGKRLESCRKQRRYLDEEMIWRIFSQILLALNECHHFKHGAILHRDLKPENIFLDKYDDVRLGDFGLSRLLNTKKDFAKTYVGTPYYMSPEQVHEAHYDTKSDIWSLGCLLYEMCALKPPFDGKDEKMLSANILRSAIQPVPSHFSLELQSLIQCLLNKDPVFRPCTEELLVHPRIRKCLRESKLRQELTLLKKKEDDLVLKLQEISRREQALALREEQVSQREKNVREAEARLAALSIKNDNRFVKSSKLKSPLEDRTNLNRTGEIYHNIKSPHEYLKMY